MGCSSSSALPPEILADPGDTEECVFTIKSTGMFNSRDCYAYKGDSTDKKDRWFLLKKIKEKKKEARAFEGERTVDLENFVREDGSKKGAVLWTAAFDSKPSFEVNGAQGAPPPWAATYVGVQVPEGHAGVLDVTMPSSATVRVAVPAGTAPGQVIQVADPGLASPALEYWRRLDGKWGPSPRSGEKISGGIASHLRCLAATADGQVHAPDARADRAGHARPDLRRGLRAPGLRAGHFSLQMALVRGGSQ